MSKRRRFPPTALASLFLLLAIGLAACSSSSGDAEAELDPATTISMELIKFKPDNLQVSRGATVTWVQNDAGFHSVVSGQVIDKAGGVTQEPDGKFKSKGISSSAEDCKCEMEEDETFSFTFDKPGRYPYYCSIHPATMRGEVRVR